MQWDDGLSSEQRNASSHWGSSARVLAGPGTGKTRALIHRIAYLLHVRNIPPDEIVVLTFTRAATKELQERLVNHLGLSKEELPLVCTLHSFALRTLLRFPSESGITLPLRVADDYEEKQVVFPEIGKIIGQPPRQIEIALKAYQATWDTLDQKHEAWQAVEYQDEFETTLEQLGKFYGFTLRSELVFRLLRFLRSNPLVGESLRIRHLLVDEYQDLNICDQNVITCLETFGAKLFVVGDDDQSIYQFRHAYPDGIRQFTAQRVEGGDYQLTICHRCPQIIIDLASNLIRRELGRINKPFNSNPSNILGEVYALQFQDQVIEAKAIANICRAYVNSGLLQPKDISILLSRRSLADPIVDAIREVGLEVTVLVNTWPLGNRDDESNEGRLIYCVLRLLADSTDTLALRTWLGLQTGVGLGTIGNIRKFCESYRLNLWQGLSHISDVPSHVKNGRKIKEYFDTLKDQLSKLESPNSLEDVLDYLVSPNSLDPSRREIREFLDHLISEEEIRNLRDLILVLQTYDIEAETLLENNAVRMMTMHKAKGLSAELVIIPAMEQGLMPDERYEEDIARRMMYVSMTRSRHILVMTHVWSRSGSQSYLGSSGGQQRRQRSQFIEQMRGVISQSGNTFVNNLSKTLATRMTLNRDQVNTAVLRDLLTIVFSDEQLMTFSYDYFRPVYEQFGTGMSKTVKIQRLIEYSTRQLEIERLLDFIRNYNPSQYAQFENKLFQME